MYLFFVAPKTNFMDICLCSVTASMLREATRLLRKSHKTVRKEALKVAAWRFCSPSWRTCDEPLDKTESRNCCTWRMSSLISRAERLSAISLAGPAHAYRVTITVPSSMQRRVSVSHIINAVGSDRGAVRLRTTRDETVAVHCLSGCGTTCSRYDEYLLSLCKLPREFIVSD